MESMCNVAQTNAVARRAPGRYNRQERANLEEQLWKTFFAEPSMWRDHRQTKRSPNYPDFKHTTNGASLWVDSRSCPDWVALKLDNFLNECPAASSQTQRIFTKESSAIPTNIQPLLKYQRKIKEGIKPSIGTILSALRMCTECKDLETGREIHRDMVQSGDILLIFIANTLVNMYAKSGSLVEGRKLFESMQTRNVVSWTVIILGHAENGEGHQALELFDRMHKEGCEPNRITILAALKACTILAEKEEWKNVNGKLVKPVTLQKCREIHTSASRIGTDLFVENSLVDVYWKCGSMPDARSVFQAMKHRDVVTWNSIILGYAQNNEGDVAFKLYDLMQREEYVPDRVTYLAALKACVALAEQDRAAYALERGREIHCLVAKPGQDMPIPVANSLIDMYAKCGSMQEAREVFNSRTDRNTVTWNSLLTGYAQNGEGHVVIKLLSQMQEERVLPDAVTYVAAVKACTTIGSLETGRNIHSHIHIEGFEGVLPLSNALVDLYCKCGSMCDAQEVFDSVKEKNVITWGTLLSGYSCQGEVQKVFNLFERMVKERVKPDEMLFLTVLTACRHAGLVGKAREYFGEMREIYGISPGIHHYTCFVDILGQANHLEEAVGVLRTMPVKADGIIWMVLLDCAVKWKDVKVAEMAFEEVMKIDKGNASAFVLMSNVYAAVGMQDDAVRVYDMSIRI